MEKVLTGLCAIGLFIGIITVVLVVACTKTVEAEELEGYPGEKHE